MYLEEELTQKTFDPPSAELTDEEVLAQAIRDPRQFRLIVDRYESAFLRKAKTILGQREEVKDAVVETFTKIYFNATRFKPVPGANFRSWAYRILFNTTISYYHKLKLRNGDLTTADFDQDLIADERVSRLMERREWRDFIVSYFHRLPAAAAKILRQFFLEDKSQVEIAETLGVSVAVVKTRLHRAKKEFRNSIRQLADPAEL
ncbi:MAG: sigma-70 family RNA polymerase sigma factor [Patescibacteria group bacterium]